MVVCSKQLTLIMRDGENRNQSMKIKVTTTDSELKLGTDDFEKISQTIIMLESKEVLENSSIQ